MRVDPIGSSSPVAKPAPTPTHSADSSYTVRRGDNLSAIAAEHGVSLSALIAANPQIRNPSLIFAGDRITIPSGASHNYTVQRGDTLGTIAARYGTTVDALAAANPGIHNVNLIYPGQTVKVPAAGGIAAAPGATTTTGAGSTAPGGSVAGIRPDAASVRAAEYAKDHAIGATGYCYKYVKQALLATGATKHYLPGVAAKDAGPALRAEGFVNVLGRPGSNIRSAYDAPPGAVLVYGPAPGATDKNVKWGHIEIRTKDGFVSDYFSANARTGAASNGLEGRGRVLIGVYIKPAAGSINTTGPTSVTGTAPVTGNSLRLSQQDIIDLKKTLQTEWVQSAGDGQAKGIIDTILNRRASGHWGNSIASVVNARNQFSDINGPVSRRDGRNSVDDLPNSVISRRVDRLVDNYLAQRASGTPSSIGSHLNYANPHYSDAVNLKWIMALDGPVLGSGNAIHRHGTTPDLERYRPGAFHVVLP